MIFNEIIHYLKKMAASFLTDRGSSRKQISKSKGCNLRQVKNPSFKEGRYSSTRKNEVTFHKKARKCKTKRPNQVNTRRNSKTELFTSSENGPLVAKNLLEDLSSFSLRSESKDTSCNTAKTNEKKYVDTEFKNQEKGYSVQGSNPMQTRVEQFYPKQNASSNFKEVNNVSKLISSMAANFEVVDKLCDTVNGSNNTSLKATGLSKSPSTPRLSPPVTPKSSSSSRDSNRTSRSSTSSFKENLSGNCPSLSAMEAKMSKSVLGPSINKSNISPLNSRHNTQTTNLSGYFSNNIVHKGSDMSVKTHCFGNKDEDREEMQFIKGKKCIKCGYSSVKNSDLLRHVRCVHFKIRDFSCHICSYKCFGSSSLGQHIKSVHLKIKDHACKICGYQASRRADINKHMRYRHKLQSNKIHKHVIKIEGGDALCNELMAENNVDDNQDLPLSLSLDNNDDATNIYHTEEIADNEYTMPDLSFQVKERQLNDPKLENTNELPKVAKRCLRSISPPRLIQEAALEKNSHAQHTSWSGSKRVSNNEQPCIIQEIQVVENGNEPSSGSPYRQSFREEWLKDPELSSWIQKYPPDVTKTFCPICQITIGSKHSSLITHSNSGGHDKCLKELKLKFKKPNDLSLYLKTSLCKYLKNLKDRDRQSTGERTAIISRKETEGDFVGGSIRSPHRQIFREEWLADRELTPWLQKHEEDPTKAFCPICRISLMAKHSTLISHSKSGGHINNLKIKKGNEKSGTCKRSANSSPKRHNTAISIKQCDNPPEISNKNSPRKTLKCLTASTNSHFQSLLNSNLAIKKNLSVKEKWETSGSEIQRILTKKERTKINGESCHAFKLPLPKSSPSKAPKKPSKHLTNKRKVGKGFKSKSKKKDIGSLKLLKKSKMSSSKEKFAQEENRSHRSGSISSNCSSSSIYVKTINSGSVEIDSKTLNKLILKQCKKEKMRLNPVQKQLLRNPIMCHLCDFIYSYEDETISRNEIRLKMIEHFELDHVKKVEKSPLDFNCDFCPYSAPFQLMLTSHLIVQHPQKKPIFS